MGEFTALSRPLADLRVVLLREGSGGEREKWRGREKWSEGGGREGIDAPAQPREITANRANRPSHGFYFRNYMLLIRPGSQR